MREFDPVQSTTRRCTRNAQLAGVAIAEGDWVEVGLGSANRDERVYVEPAVFSLERENPRDHLAFGGGSHICPGASLARLEGRTAVEVLLDRVAVMSRIDGVEYPPLPSSLSDLPIPTRLTPTRQG